MHAFIHPYAPLPSLIDSECRRHLPIRPTKFAFLRYNLSSTATTNKQVSRRGEALALISIERTQVPSS